MLVCNAGVANTPGRSVDGTWGVRVCVCVYMNDPARLITTIITTPTTPTTTFDPGFEMHMATNYLGHFYLIKLLLDVAKATEGGARIVNVSSLMHEFGCVDFQGSLEGRYRSWKDVRELSAIRWGTGVGFGCIESNRIDSHPTFTPHIHTHRHPPTHNSASSAPTTTTASWPWCC